MIYKKRIVLFSIVLGGLIGSFPLLTGQVAVPPTKVVAATAVNNPALEIDVDARKVHFEGSETQEDMMMVNNYAYIPVRYLERLGGEVRWDEETRKVFVEMKR